MPNLSRRHLVIGLVGVAATGLFVWATAAALEARAWRIHLERLRSDLAALRTASNECLAAVAQEQAAFSEYNERVDSLRGRVRELESMDRRGIPVARYDEYLETFDEYNLAVPEWRTQVDSLNAHRDACEEIVLVHNELTDSVRRVVEARARGGR